MAGTCALGGEVATERCMREGVKEDALERARRALPCPCHVQGAVKAEREQLSQAEA